MREEKNILTAKQHIFLVIKTGISNIEVGLIADGKCGIMTAKLQGSVATWVRMANLSDAGHASTFKLNLVSSCSSLIYDNTINNTATFYLLTYFTAVSATVYDAASATVSWHGPLAGEC